MEMLWNWSWSLMNQLLPSLPFGLEGYCLGYYLIAFHISSGRIILIFGLLKLSTLCNGLVPS